jgi:hypothetical protein
MHKAAEKVSGGNLRGSQIDLVRFSRLFSVYVSDLELRFGIDEMPLPLALLMYSC